MEGQRQTTIAEACWQSSCARLSSTWRASNFPMFGLDYIGVTLDHFPHFPSTWPQFLGMDRDVMGEGWRLLFLWVVNFAALIDGDDEYCPTIGSSHKPVPFHSIVRRCCPQPHLPIIAGVISD